MSKVGALIRSRSVTLAAAVVAALVTVGAGAGTARAQSRGPVGISDPIQRVDIVNGGLVATAVDGQQLPLGLTARRVAGASCPILDLSLGPISLNLLGLNVNTSQICLAITAEPGSGALLGNLLCSVARLLDRGVPLADILAQLTQAQQAFLVQTVLNLLNGALNQLNNAVVTAVQQAGTCSILDLALGPIDLNLLGLRVQLDDCHGGPVTVAVSAVPGTGNLLGNLLCGLLGNTPLGTTLGAILGGILGGLLGALG